jgi:DNA-binding NarL/FixJ family response regulator
LGLIPSGVGVYQSICRAPGEAERMAIRILLADDHALMREGIRKILEEADDLEVVGEAGDGQEAVRLTRQLRPDVVLMDIAMPEMNGVEATREIKEVLPRTAILALSAYDEDAYVFALLEAGAAGYLLKGALSRQLVAAIQSVHQGESVLAPSVTRKLFAHTSNHNQNERPHTLSERELEVLRLAGRGLSTRAIALALDISPRTVQFHLTQIFTKLNVGSRTEAVVSALRHGWLDLAELDAVE